MRFHFLILATLLTLSIPREAKAWSRDGHRIVCRIAWFLLDDARRVEIERLTSTYRDDDGQPLISFWDACSFPDEVRAKAANNPAFRRFAVFETWHYANVPRSTTQLPDPPCQVPCVINAIPAHADSLRRATNDRSRAEAVFFLSHWVGDMHQPLHLGYQDDRGGNDIRPIEGGYYSVSSMHALWDGGIPGKLFASATWQAFADQLAIDITPAQRATWIQGSATDWAQESYNLITSPKAQYCEWQSIGGSMSCMSRPGSRVISEQYQAEFADDVMMRLQQAGVRLAELLRTNLNVPSR
jgi:nuclease S1